MALLKSFEVEAHVLGVGPKKVVTFAFSGGKVTKVVSESLGFDLRFNVVILIIFEIVLPLLGDQRVEWPVDLVPGLI